jgi:deoxyribodipyrimidine photolyase
MKTLVWITNSFRLDSRLTHSLSGPCSFVFYSPYYFAGKREREIYEKCSQENLDIFYYSLHNFDKDLQSKGCSLNIFKHSDPISHINELAKKYQFDKLVIDQPLFAMWHTIDLLKLEIPYEIIDSALIDDKCFKMTAKSRWMSHTRDLSTPFHKWNSEITHFQINEKSRSYPQSKKEPNPYIDLDSILSRALLLAPTYFQTRDKHNGQTQLSTILHNGMLDPKNVFYSIVNIFKQKGANFAVNEGAHAAMLRQFTFREINIITARKNNLTLENTPQEWAQTLMHHKSYENMMQSTPKLDSDLTFEKISKANTGVNELDTILSSFVQTGIMPNRARMYFAGKIFYESKTGLSALETIIDTFDLIGIDGQSPNNYIQCVSSLNLTYGKVMLMSAKRTFELLDYK